jgi:hypothetical protein
MVSIGISCAVAAVILHTAYAAQVNKLHPIPHRDGIIHPAAVVEATTNCRIMGTELNCALMTVSPDCPDCTNSFPTECGGVPVIQCQSDLSYNWSSINSEIPWVVVNGQVITSTIGKDFIITSNRDFHSSYGVSEGGMTINTLTFTSAALFTQLNWTWINATDYGDLYFNFINVSTTASPSSGPTTAPSTGPTTIPSFGPTAAPSTGPTTVPSFGPTTAPSTGPTTIPSFGPTIAPSTGPTTIPSSGPTTAPSTGPTTIPSSGPTVHPAAEVEATTNCRITAGDLNCGGMTVSPDCPDCTNTFPTECGGVPVIQCQSDLSYNWSSINSEIPWVVVNGQASSSTIGKDFIITSNRDFHSSYGVSEVGMTINTLTFTSAAVFTQLNWTWINATDYGYLYFNFINISTTASPSFGPTTAPSTGPTIIPSFGPTAAPSTGPTTVPSFGPTTAPSTAPTTILSFGPTNAPTGGPTSILSSGPTTAPSNPTTIPSFGPSNTPTSGPTATPTAFCDATPCPTSCLHGYTPTDNWFINGCWVYCTTEPVGNQCDPGGSGCTSSCNSAPTVAPTAPTPAPTTVCQGSPCPTSCPAGYTGDSFTSDGCTVFCDSPPTEGQCRAGGSGCTSSCRLGPGPIVGIALAAGALIIVAATTCCWKVGICCFVARQPKSNDEISSTMNPL